MDAESGYTYRRKPSSDIEEANQQAIKKDIQVNIVSSFGERAS